VQFDPHPKLPKTLTAQIANAVPTASRRSVQISIDTGWFDGVRAGWKGKFVTESGAPVPGLDFVVTSVTNESLVGILNDKKVEDLGGHRRVKLSAS
jgi:hypothetical protein